MRGVLDGDRHAVERPERCTAAPALRRLRGQAPPLRFIQQADGVENRIDPMQLRQRGFQHINRRQAAISEPPYHLAGGQPVQLVRHAPDPKM
jgi:hypothetical protein